MQIIFLASGYITLGISKRGINLDTYLLPLRARD